MQTCRVLTCAVLIAASPAAAARRVEIFFNLPDGIGSFSGLQPATFGAPFERGVLKKSDGVRVVDESGWPVRAQFDVTATWGPDSDDVRWLLVDLLVPLHKGQAPRRFLEFGPDVSKPVYPSQPAPWRDPLYSAQQSVLVDGEGTSYPPSHVRTNLERHGPVRSVVKQTGRYVSERGDWIADFVTRCRVDRDCSVTRIYHTLIWQTDASKRIGALTFRLSAAAGDGQASAGLDGKRVGPAKSLSLRQTDWNAVKGDAAGSRLDGWIEWGDGQETLLAALRWPWQQHPTSLSARNGRIEVGLIAREEPLSLKAEDVAVAYTLGEMEKWNLRIFDDKGGLWSVKYNGPEARPHISPRGAAKTYEMAIWRGDAETEARVKNILIQHPVLAHLDPVFAVKASLPSPMAAQDKNRWPLVEGALERAFEWITRENAFDGDYGLWNFGDVQWLWAGRAGYTVYRYWMNHGKGWSVAPWALWLRSGDRRYWEHGEKNSRHCMDVDACHVPEWRIAADGKVRGGQNHYSALHWGYGPEVSTFFVDSEYLPYCYYLTGYERAWDVLLERAESLARDDWRLRVAHFKQSPDSRSRHLYSVLRDLAVLYQATWDERLKPQLTAFLDLTLDAQLPNGKFLNITSNHYLDHALHLAAQALPDQNERIVQSLRRWYEFQGDWIDPRPGAAAIGPDSLWTAYALARATGQARYARAAILTARGQALSVADSDTAWNGMTAFPAHLAGPILRDWPIALKLAEESAQAGDLDQFPPLTHFHAQFPLTSDQKAQSPESRGRHIVLVLNNSGDPFTVNLHFLMHNQGLRGPAWARVYAPNGDRLVEVKRDIEQSGTDAAAVQGLPLSVPGAGKGVYTVETWRSYGALPVFAKSSTGKVVHYLPPGRRCLCSPTFGGVAWGRPQNDAEIAIGYPADLAEGRIVAIDSAHRLLASSRITGTQEADTLLGRRQSPKGEPCRLRPPIRPGLCGLSSCNLDWHSFQEIRGLQPWIASAKEEWFDPAEYPHPDWDQLLGPLHDRGLRPQPRQRGGAARE